MWATCSVRLARNAEPHGHRVVLRLERTPAAQTMDASGTALLECRFYGCLVPHLYNQHRPHSALDDRTPAEFAASWVDHALSVPELAPEHESNTSSGCLLEAFT
jgi:hypothetical protein